MAKKSSQGKSAHTSTIPAGQWSETAVRVLKERYLLKDEQGNVVETPSEAMWRVADAIAQAELKHQGYGRSESEENYKVWRQRFFDIMNNRLFMPNSPTLMNAGKNNGLQLSACYVVPVPDSLDGIFESLKHAALIHKSGGGTGFSFSRLRPKNAFVGSTQGVSSGPVSFMRIFDAATENIKQGGTRRGANMGVLRVDHPDVMEFINCKRDGSVTNFNISVGITDTFMRALNHVPGKDMYALVDPHTGRVVGQMSAHVVMDEIIDAAWSTGDPGLIFLDRVNASPANPTPDIEPIEATNPCGEQPLGPYDACNLGSINLGAFVRDSEKLEEAIDWAGLRDTVNTAVRFLDNVIDENPYPLPEVRTKVEANRRIGLGIMGWADMLFKLGIRYDSEDAVKLGEQVMAVVSQQANTMSANLGVARGNFPNFDRSRYADTHRHLRNSNRTTVAPTGTISIIADCSSGIEPIFALAFQHRVKQPDGTYRVLDFVNPLFREAVEKSDLTANEKALVLKHVVENGSLNGLAGNGIATIKLAQFEAFVTAQEIAPEWHIAMQAAFQKSVDSAISKTVNLPNEATRDDVRASYEQAWTSGCLGITIFRDGCKGEQVLNVGVKKDAPKIEAPTDEVTALRQAVIELEAELAKRENEVTPIHREIMASHHAQISSYAEQIKFLDGKIGELEMVNKRLWGELETLKHPTHFNAVKQRPTVVRGYTRQITAPEGKVNVTINSDDGGVLEIFVNVGRAGSDVAALAEALGRLISLVLRVHSNLPQNERALEVARQLRGIGGSSSVGFGPKRVMSLPDAIAQAIEEHFREPVETPEELQRVSEPAGIKGIDEPQDANAVDVEDDEPPTVLLPVVQKISPTPVLHKSPKSKSIKLGNVCSSCGNNTLVLEEGCSKCLSCGMSKC